MGHPIFFRYRSGQDCKGAKLKNYQAMEVCRLAWETDIPAREIGALFGISPVTVINIKNGYAYPRACFSIVVRHKPARK